MAQAAMNETTRDMPADRRSPIPRRWPLPERGFRLGKPAPLRIPDYVLIPELEDGHYGSAGVKSTQAVPTLAVVQLLIIAATKALP